jgi:hypothetical protein
MPHLAISPKQIPHASPPDFGVEVLGSSLLVPQDLAVALDRLSVRTAEDFISYLHTFPGTVAALLNWSLDDVIDARSSLISRLHGIVDENILDPPQPPQRTYGARFPIRRRHY